MQVTDDHNGQNNPFYASQDDLLNRVKLNEWTDFVNFVAAIRDSAKLANVGVWPEESVDLIEIKVFGFRFRTVAYTMISIPMVSLPFTLWTLMSTSGGSHPSYGTMNGVTRFYSPLLKDLEELILIWKCLSAERHCRF